MMHRMLAACFVLAAALAAGAEPAQAVTEHGDVILADGTTFAYHVRPGDGPTLVLIPGSWGEYHVFDDLIPHLEPEIHVIIIELRGHGGSQPGTNTPSMELFADDVLHVIRALRLDDYYVGGHSIGGMLAIEIAGRSPKGLSGIISMEGWTHHTVEPNAFGQIEGTTLTPEEQAIRLERRTAGQSQLTEEQIEAFADVWKRWNGSSILEESPLPVLEIWGDRAQPEKPTREILQIPDRPNIEMAYIEGASHGYLIEDPAAVAAAVNAFLGKYATK